MAQAINALIQIFHHNLGKLIEILRIQKENTRVRIDLICNGKWGIIRKNCEKNINVLNYSGCRFFFTVALFKF